MSQSHQSEICRDLYQQARRAGCPAVKLVDLGCGQTFGETADGQFRSESVNGCCAWAKKYAIASAWLENQPTAKLTDDERRLFGDLFAPAIALIRKSKRASTTSFQRRLKVGYNKAHRMLLAMERLGIVGPEIGASPRELLKP